MGAQHFPTVAMAVVNGGHVRVGLEDNLYMSKGVLAEGNAPVVARAARIIREIGAEVANAYAGPPNPGPGLMPRLSLPETPTLNRPR